jgi:S1-C subfamily serine protease
MKKRMRNAMLQRALSILSLLLFISSIAEAKVPDIVLKHKKAVVTICVYKEDDQIATGTGFIIGSDGIIATNYHVISELLEGKDTALLVRMENGAFFITKDLISFNKDNDIALFKVEGKELPKVKLTSTYKSKQGESIVVIGSPNGLETTVSEGIISGIRKKDKLQITAPISAGSSGSPVFNLKGKVIGVVNSSIDSGQNLNFAIPVSGVASLFNDYKKSKKKVMPAQKAPTSVSTPEAMVKLEEAKTEVKKNPDNAETHNNLGLCYTKLGKYDMGKEAFKQALRIMPDFAEAHFNLGIVYIILNDRGSALEEYKILKELNREMANDFFNKIYE